MNKVYLFEHLRPHMKLAPVDKWGELDYIFDGTTRRHSIFEVNEYTHDVVFRLQEVQFDETDSICIVGNLIQNVLGIAAALSCFEAVHILLFNARTEVYERKRLERNHRNISQNV